MSDWAHTQVCFKTSATCNYSYCPLVANKKNAQDRDKKLKVCFLQLRVKHLSPEVHEKMILKERSAKIKKLKNA